MGVLVGLLAGAGLLSCWSACWSRPPGGAQEPRASRWRRDLADDLVAAGGRAGDVPAVLGACAVLALGVGLVVLVVSRTPVVAAAFTLVVARLPLVLVRGRARRRRASLRELWPDAVDHLASGVRAGLSLPEALASLAERGPEPLRPAFRAFAEDHRATGRFSACLDALKARLADPVADRVVEALRLARDVGGSDLGRLLRTLSAFLRDDARARAELETRQGWTVNGARLAVAAPWVVLALLATRAQAVAAYETATGAAVLGGGAVASFVAYRLMAALGRLPEDQRVLR